MEYNDASIAIQGRRMPSVLMDIDVLLFEHEGLRKHLKLVIKQITSGNVKAENIPSKAEEDNWRRSPGLIQVLTSLENSLKHHFVVEEGIMEMLLDHHIVRSVRQDHFRIAREYEQIKALLEKDDCYTLALENKKAFYGVEKFCNLVMEHLDKEDVVLNLLRSEMLIRARI